MKTLARVLAVTAVLAIALVAAAQTSTGAKSAQNSDHSSNSTSSGSPAQQGGQAGTLDGRSPGSSTQLAAMVANPSVLFKKLDTDSDGKLTPEEFAKIASVTSEPRPGEGGTSGPTGGGAGPGTGGSGAGTGGR